MNRDWFAGKRVAVAGMGVSGLAVGRAVKRLGGHAVVLDQQPGDVPRVMAAVDRLQNEEIEAVTGWHGRLDAAEFDLLVVSPGLPRQHPVMADMAGKVIGEVEFAYRVAEAPILAITGTNGKSTTTVMLWLMLRGAGVEAALCGNIAGTGYPEQVLTDAAMSTSAEGFLVAEISSAQLETVSSFRPRVGYISNITDDHRDRYPDFEDYRNAKLNLFNRIGEGDVVVLNRDGRTVTEAMVRERAEEAAILSFSTEEAVAGDVLRLGDQDLLISELPFFGRHNLTNALAAWTMASAVVGEDAGLVDGLLRFRHLDNRMELLGERGGVRVINNSMCTNPEAVVASSRSLEGRQHLLMGGNTKNMDFSPVRDYLAGVEHKVYLFGPDPGRMNGMIGGAWPSFATLGEAFGAAALAAAPGETVMLAPGCASAEPYRNFRERGDAFRAIAKEWLNNEPTTGS